MDTQTTSQSTNGTQSQNKIEHHASSLPKGGGAIRGIGGKFQANAVTGTGAFKVPLPISPGHSGFAPQLALSYDSGAGNSEFGLGWKVGVPSITRKIGGHSICVNLGGLFLKKTALRRRALKHFIRLFIGGISRYEFPATWPFSALRAS